MLASGIQIHPIHEKKPTACEPWAFMINDFEPVTKTGSYMRGPSWNRWASKLVPTPVADFRFGGAVEFLVHLFHFRTLALRLPPSPGDGGRRYDHDQAAHGPTPRPVGTVVLNHQRP